MASRLSGKSLPPSKQEEMSPSAGAPSPRQSPLRRKGRGALMAAAAAEQRSILAAGGELPDQFANWRSVKSRVRAGGKLAAMALELQETLGSTPAGAVTPHPSPQQQGKRGAAQVSGAVPVTQGKRRKRGPASLDAPGNTTERQMPPKYAQLEALFRMMESICGLLALRKKACTYENVKKPLEDAMGRRFSLSLLAQLVAVYPEAFVLQYTPVRRPAPASATPGLLTDAQTPPGSRWELRIALQPAVTLAGASDQAPLPGVATGSWLREQSQRRLQGFRERLMGLADIAHRTFLQQQNLPDATGWHPAFDLDQVPDIPCAPLPSPPRSRPSAPPPVAPGPLPDAPAASPSSELALDPAGSALSPGHAGSPFGPLAPLMPRALDLGGPPTPRSLAASFDLVAEAPTNTGSGAGERESLGVGNGGACEVPHGRTAQGRSEGGVVRQVASGTRSNPHCISSFGGVREGGRSSTSSGTDSDCRVMGSAGPGHEGADSPTVRLPADGDTAAAGLHGVPLNILHQVAAKQQRSEEENSVSALARHRRRGMLAQLPGLVNLLRSVAAAEGRCVVREEQLVARLLSAHPRLTDQGELREQLALLQHLAPAFLSTTTATDPATPLVKINLTADFATLKRTLARAK